MRNEESYELVVDLLVQVYDMNGDIMCVPEHCMPISMMIYPVSALAYVPIFTYLQKVDTSYHNQICIRIKQILQ